MGTESRTFVETRAAHGYGACVLGFAFGPAVCAFAGFDAPLRWPGTSWAEGIAIGAVFTALTAWVLRAGLRIWHSRLVVSPGGVEVHGWRRDHRLRWDEIQSFREGWTAGVTIAALNGMPVVVIDLRDGRSITVHALRVDRGRAGRAKAGARVRELCGELEALRPATAASRAPRSHASTSGRSAFA